MLERAWGLSESLPEEKLKEKEQIKQKRKETKKEVDTKEDWSSPICGKKHRLIHVETETAIKHMLREPPS